MSRKPHQRGRSIGRRFAGRWIPWQSSGPYLGQDRIDDLTGDYRAQILQFVNRLVIGFLAGASLGAVYGVISQSWQMGLILALLIGTLFAIGVWHHHAGR